MHTSVCLLITHPRSAIRKYPFPCQNRPIYGLLLVKVSDEDSNGMSRLDVRKHASAFLCVTFSNMIIAIHSLTTSQRWTITSACALSKLVYGRKLPKHINAISMSSWPIPRGKTTSSNGAPVLTFGEPEWRTIASCGGITFRPKYKILIMIVPLSTSYCGITPLSYSMLLSSGFKVRAAALNVALAHPE